MNQGKTNKQIEDSGRNFFIGMIGIFITMLIIAFLTTEIMTKFQIKREGLIIGYEYHRSSGVSYRKIGKYELQDDTPGAFPANETDTKILVSKKESDRREEKR